MKALTEEQDRILSWILKKEFYELETWECTMMAQLIEIAGKLGYDVLASEMTSDMSIEQINKFKQF